MRLTYCQQQHLLQHRRNTSRCLDNRQQTALWRRLVPGVYMLPWSAPVVMGPTLQRRSLAPATRHLANTKAKQLLLRAHV